MTVFQKRPPLKKTRSFTFGRQPIPNATGIDGIILDLTEPMQEKNFKTKEPEFWDKEQQRPKMMVGIEMQTQLKEAPEEDGTPDDGRRIHFVTVDIKQGGELSAIQDAVEAAGAEDLAPGGRLAVWFTGYDPASANPDQPRRLFQARYAPPPSGGGAFQPQGQQAQPPQQPAYQPPAQPQTQQFHAQAQQPAYQPPAQPQGQQFGGGGFGGQPPAQPAYTQSQPAQGFPPAQPAGYPPAAGQQGEVSFTTNGPVDTRTGEIMPQGFPAPQRQEVQVNAQDIRQRLQQGQPDGQIMAETGASLEAISAIRNLG